MTLRAVVTASRMPNVQRDSVPLDVLVANNGAQNLLECPGASCCRRCSG